jgi:hypothetical protein
MNGVRFPHTLRNRRGDIIGTETKHDACKSQTRSHFDRVISFGDPSLAILLYTPPYGRLALLASAIVFAAYTLSSVKRRGNTVGYGNIYFGVSALTLVAVATIKALIDAQSPYGEWEEYACTWLAVMGFPTSLILGVWQHTSEG